ncbi:MULTISPECIES: hypothetical protein [Micromonospora]|nr:hypothetical protein [Micromonospora hortensis]WTI07934.1 hypothetical protein OHB44_31995 [Micromonospora sp. NBC_00821]
MVRPAAVGRDRLLLIGGVLAGPIFVGSAIVQAVTFARAASGRTD